MDVLHRKSLHEENLLWKYLALLWGKVKKSSFGKKVLLEWAQRGKGGDEWNLKKSWTSGPTTQEGTSLGGTWEKKNSTRLQTENAG